MNLRNTYYKKLNQQLSNITNQSEMDNLLKGLFTLREQRIIALRLEIAKRILGGQHYDDIQRELGAGANNIKDRSIAIKNGFFLSLR